MILALLACTSNPDTGPEPSLDSDWPELEVAGPDALEPGWTGSQAGLAFQAALEGPYPDVRGICQTYLDWIARGDEVCPGGLSLQPPAVTLEGCTSTSGVHYAGLSGWSEDADRWGLQVGDFRLTDPDGRSFLAGGEAVLGEAGGSQTLNLRGSFHDTGAGGWLGQGGSAVLQLVGGPQGVMAQVSMQTAAGALYTEQLVLGSDCMEGEVYLRGLEGGWYSMDLECGCAQVRFGDADLGEACLEIAPIREAMQEVL